MPTYEVELHGRRFRMEARDEAHMVESVNQLDEQIRNENAEGHLQAQVDETPRTRGWFADVGASATRGVLKAWDASARLLGEMGIPDYRVNLFNGRPFIEAPPSDMGLLITGGVDPRGPTSVESGIEGLGEPQTVAGGFAESTSQFVTGYLATKRVTGAVGVLQKLGGAGAAIKATADGAVASGVFFRGQEANLANLVQMAPALQNPVTEFLAVDESTPELEGRLKNAITDALGGTAVEGVIRIIKAAKAGRVLKAAEDAEIAADAAPQATPAQPAGTATESLPPPLKESEIFNPREFIEPHASTADAIADGAPGFADETVDRLSRKLGVTDEKLTELRAALDAGVPPEDLERLVDLNPKHVDWSAVRTPEDVVALMNKVTEVMGPTVAKRAGYAPQTVEWLQRQAGKLAEETGGGYSAAVGILDRVKDLPATVILQRKLVTASAAQLRTLAEKVANGAATPADVVEFMVHDKRHALLQVTARGTRAQVGRALRVMQEGVKVSEEAARIGKAKVAREERRAAEQAAKAGKAAEVRKAKPASGSLTIADAAEAARAAGTTLDDVYQLAREIMSGKYDIEAVSRKARTSTWFSTFNERLSTLYINNILSGLPTLVVNVTSGFYKMVESSVERYGAAALSYARGDKWDRVAANKAAVATFTSWRAALTMAGKAWKEGVPQVDTIARSEAVKHGGVPTSGAGQFFTAPSRVILTIDEFFKTIFYQQEMAARAVEVAAAAARLEKHPLKAEGVFARTLREMTENPPDDVALDAMESARYNTFQSDPRNRLITWLSNGANNVPFLRLVIPFIKTPYNIVAQGMERSPLGLLQKRVREELSGMHGRRAQEVAVTRMAVGTAAMGTVWQMVDQGVLTGSSAGGKGNKNTSDLEAPPYSIRIGDKWYSYARLDPMGTMIGLTADLAQYNTARNGRLSNDTTLDDPEAGEAAGALAAIFTEQLADKTFFKGVSDLFDFFGKVEDGEGFGAGANYATGVLQNLVPYSSMLRNIARSNDSVQREAWTLLDRVRANTPGFSDELPARFDLLGRKVEQTDRVGPDWASPFLVAKDDPDPVAKALAEADISYRMPRKEVGNVKLDAATYSRYLELRGAEVYRLVNDRLQSGSWDRMTAMQREMYMDQVFSAATRRAGAELLKENSDVLSAITEQRQEIARARSGAN